MNETLDLFTYFFIEYQVDKEKRECGPYTSLQYATEVLVDHIPLFASAEAQKEKYNYKAEIQERTFDLDTGRWLTISTPLLENPCRMQKPKPKQQIMQKQTLKY